MWGKGIGAVRVKREKKGGYFVFSWEGERRWRKMDRFDEKILG